MSAAPIATAAATRVRVEARALSHRFGARLALEPQSFVLEGGIVAVTGPNGSGKTTLLRILAGLLRPGAGAVSVSIDGLDLPAAARRLRVGLVTPELSFYEALTLEENLVFAAEARGLPNPHRAAGAAIERSGLAARAGDRVSALSSGLRQRARLAFASLGDPPLLLLDEPGSHLDEDARAGLEVWIREAAHAGLVLLATNDEREWRIAERRIQLRGRDLGHTA
jgi:heme exporter protein A